METINIETINDVNYLRRKVAEMLSSAKKGITVTIKTNRKLKSNQQRGYYWGVIVRTLSEGLGFFRYDDHLVHEGLKELFCPVKTNKAGFKVRSTELLDKKETEEYYSKCRMYASIEFGIFIPLPNEEEV